MLGGIVSLSGMYFFTLQAEIEIAKTPYLKCLLVKKNLN